MGLELQLEELNEQRERARVQGRTDDVARLERDIEALQAELAVTAEYLAVEGPIRNLGPSSSTHRSSAPSNRGRARSVEP